MTSNAPEILARRANPSWLGVALVAGMMAVVGVLFTAFGTWLGGITAAGPKPFPLTEATITAGVLAAVGAAIAWLVWSKDAPIVRATAWGALFIAVIIGGYYLVQLIGSALEEGGWAFLLSWSVILVTLLYSLMAGISGAMLGAIAGAIAGIATAVARRIVSVTTP
jgi:hypothetical protein